jgi:hypothetical protein
MGPLAGSWVFHVFASQNPPFAEAPINLVGANFYLSAFLALLGGLAAAWAVRRPTIRPVGLKEPGATMPAGEASGGVPPFQK